MYCKKTLKRALRSNLSWFENSGVMIPDNGLWGVAERVALKGNSAIEQIYRSFPAWTEFSDHSIIEQRRADCNFETAFLFLLGSDVFKVKKYYDTAENILDFLYFRSGMLNRTPADENLSGAWYWSHISKPIYFDDNSWNCTIQLLISKKYPDLDNKYNMKNWALLLADNMATGFMSHFQAAEDFTRKWAGNLNLPHWGSLVCMAMAKAYEASPRLEYKAVVDKYYQFLDANKDSFITSEQAYAVIGAGFCYHAFKDQKFIKLAEFFGNKLIVRMDPATNNIPAEHYEAPKGQSLADMIYTVNWALLGFQILQNIDNDMKYRDAFLKLLGLAIKIQDQSQEKHLNGCWRGMYDLTNNCWGGGDCYEGGAKSIYTGWTNTTIASCIGLEILQKPIFDN